MLSKDRFVIRKPKTRKKLHYGGLIGVPQFAGLTSATVLLIAHGCGVRKLRRRGLGSCQKDPYWSSPGRPSSETIHWLRWSPLIVAQRGIVTARNRPPNSKHRGLDLSRPKCGLSSHFQRAHFCKTDHADTGGITRVPTSSQFFGIQALVFIRVVLINRTWVSQLG